MERQVNSYNSQQRWELQKAPQGEALQRKPGVGPGQTSHLIQELRIA
ncbi:rCG22422 [Rattus norvegicus]|uniref:RCG22422 n=1 Tax=Rattus norvegicus TaxID=10116 RepID=A6IP00_RAT|nr:rCG22422 [Rattus norvegicus]